MNFNKFAAYLFDLDGVLIDTEAQYSAIWQRLGEKFFPTVADFAWRIKGHTLADIFEEYVGDDTELRAAIREELTAQEYQMTYPWLPGAQYLAELLYRENALTAVVTSSDNLKMARVYEYLPEMKNLFTHVFTAENVARSKPAPDCYLNAAHRLGVPIEQCVVFEDSISGLQAAQASGAFVVGLATTLNVDEVEKYSNETIKDLTEYIKVLNNVSL